MEVISLDVNFSIGKKSDLPSSLSAGMIRITYDSCEMYVDKDSNTRISVKDTSKAPISHASSSTTYGVSSASNYGHAKASTTTPKAAGTAALGTETSSFARGDHVHPLQTSVLGSSGSCTGNAASATKLQTARKINGVSFDGTSDITVPIDKAYLLDLIYPIGSIYISTSSTNPTNFIGGEWERFAEGQVIVGVDESSNTLGPTPNDFDENVKSSGNSGGSPYHRLTVEEMPLHSHIFSGETTSIEPIEFGHTHSIDLETTSSPVTHSHSIEITSSSNGSHKHTVTGTISSAGAHVHNYVLTPNDEGGLKRWVPDTSIQRNTSYQSGANYMQSAGNHSHILQNASTSEVSHHAHLVTGTTGSASSNHFHSVIGNTGPMNPAGGFNVRFTPKGSIRANGGNQFTDMMPPYITAYIFRRMA